MSAFGNPFKPSDQIIDDNDSPVESNDSDDSDVPAVSFSGHRDTLALLHLRKVHVSVVHTAVSLPSELVLQIYQHLDPPDFHAARHTCKKWFVASLDKTLLQTMTRRAGCSQAVDTGSNHPIGVNDKLGRLSVEGRHALEHAGHRIHDCHDFGTERFISDEWLLSKRLATEARIVPGRHIEGASMTVRDILDFSSLLPQMSLHKQELSIINTFTVSLCGKFLLVSSEHRLIVYALWPTIEPITSLECRGKVLAVSMDTSLNQYSIAVLLENRMGICWELDIGAEHSKEFDAHPSDTQAPGVCTSEQTGVQTAGAGLRMGSAEHIKTDALPVALEKTGFVLGRKHPTTVYKELGSPDDPPRSVAICPQRKCVAFGCRLGIELHWIDASTGCNLNRWFPLATSSDFLYFLPQGPDADSAKKLRLISSAGGPALDRKRGFESGAELDTRKTANDRNCRPTAQHSRPETHRGTTRLFSGSSPFALATMSIVPNMWPAATGVLRTIDCDHYRAIPLSDGLHMLFTDPTSGLLCLGSDAPLGSPTKLVRRFVFLPPGYVSTTTKLLPTCYSAACDLQWGVRVVATYADGSLVLFNIPTDCFNYVKQVRIMADP